MTQLDKLVPTLDGLEYEELLQTFNALENLLAKTKDLLAAKTVQEPAEEGPANPVEETPPPPATTTSDELFQFHEHPLDDSLTTEVHRHLKTLSYHPNNNNTNSPDIFLYGSLKYTYNQQSATVEPAPILPGTIMGNLLETVNKKLNTTFDSMLVNKYRNVNCSLGAHKDDERCIDQSSPIATLSLGSVRRLQMSSNDNKTKVVNTVFLTPHSIFCMLPGFQEKYYHSVPAGRGSIKKEKGIRFSVTFRRLLPPTEEHSLPAHRPDTDASITLKVPVASTNAKTEDTHPDALVFGSSLTKGLKARELSKYNRRFKVFTNRGAHVKDIYEDIERELQKGVIDTSKVKCVFLVCGGNDIEAIKEDCDMKFLREDFEDLFNLTREAFPQAKVNVISILPRRSKYRLHISNMHSVNEWLQDFCRMDSIRFVDMFSFFLHKRPTIWSLNSKLFNGSKLHFNSVGDSVLAKVLIGVANRPL